jgi:photosystem II stability/assembly factor-like uncharacterized protein
MKKLFLAVLIILVNLIQAQTWKTAVKPNHEYLNDGYMLTASLGWFVGGYGTIYKTTDGGVTLTEQFKHTLYDFDFYGIQFLDANIGFVCGEKCTIMKTTNGGTNWSKLPSPDTITTLYALYFYDVNNGYILSTRTSPDTSRIYKTSNGGITWTLQLTHTGSDLEEFDFFDATHGVAVGGGLGKMDLYYTTNGTSWTKATNPTVPSGYTRLDVHAVQFVTQSVVYACGWGSSVGLQPSIHLKSTDGGATWTYLTQAANNKTYVNLNGIYFKDALNGVAAGGASFEGTVIVRTSDGGTNWIPISNPFGYTASALIGKGEHIWIPDNALGFSNNFGNSFSLLTKIPSGTVYAIQFVNNNIGYAAGYNGIFLKTTDGGINWIGSYTKVNDKCPNSSDIHFINQNVGYITRGYRGVIKTTNGGTTWFSVLADTNSTSMPNESVYFIDENNGFVAGRIASNLDAIYKTTNGGISWTVKTGQANKNLNAIAFANQTTGCAFANDSKALFTTDAGATWTQSTFTNLPGGLLRDISDLVFYDGLKGIAVGEDATIFTTTNGGAVWNYSTIAGSLIDLSAVDFKSTSNFYTCGSDYLYETTDGGINWIVKLDSSFLDRANLYSIDISPNGFIWLGSGSSKIFSNAPYLSLNKEMNEQPNNFELNQNYPNPFNPSTTISFELKTSTFVTLKIFDILGNEVAKLIEKEMTPGFHELNYSVKYSELNSGVYFYRLQAGNKMETKKMILIK